MKRWTYVLAVVLFLAVVGGAIAVYADSGDLLDSEGPPDQANSTGWGRRLRLLRGLRGEVTAVDETGLTILTRNEVSVQVNVTEQTRVWLAETQARGTLSDVEVGDRVLVRGRRAEESQPEAPAVDARRIVVAPDGDKTHGRVTGVVGTTIRIQNRDGEASIATNEETEFRRCALGRGCREGSLDDVTEGRFVVAFGETQPDGSLLARLVYLYRGMWNHPLSPHGSGARPGVGGPDGDQLPDLRLSSHPDNAPENL